MGIYKILLICFVILVNAIIAHRDLLCCYFFLFPLVGSGQGRCSDHRDDFMTIGPDPNR